MDDKQGENPDVTSYYSFFNNIDKYYAQCECKITFTLSIKYAPK